MSTVANTTKHDAQDLLYDLLRQVSVASSQTEWAQSIGTLHGAGRMAYRLGIITFDEWKSFDDRADAVRPRWRAA